MSGQTRRILIIHGWMHSKALYEDLAEDLAKDVSCRVDFYEFPGFGGVSGKYRHNILDRYARDLRAYLHGNVYDAVIAHSMGGAVLLRALESVSQETKVLLLSPEYMGINMLKPLILVKPLLPFLIALLKIPCRATNVLIRGMSLFTINHWEEIDGKIIDATRSADPMTAAGAMMELAFDSYRLTRKRRENTYLILGGRDRIISKRKMVRLYRDLGTCKVFCVRKSGHTLVLENFDALTGIVKSILRE